MLCYEAKIRDRDHVEDKELLICDNMVAAARAADSKAKAVGGEVIHLGSVEVMEPVELLKAMVTDTFCTRREDAIRTLKIYGGQRGKACNTVPS